jgi:hypothetical protein
VLENAIDLMFMQCLYLVRGHVDKGLDNFVELKHDIEQFEVVVAVFLPDVVGDYRFEHG